MPAVGLCGQLLAVGEADAWPERDPPLGIVCVGRGFQGEPRHELAGLRMVAEQELVNREQNLDAGRLRRGRAQMIEALDVAVDQDREDPALDRLGRLRRGGDGKRTGDDPSR